MHRACLLTTVFAVSVLAPHVCLAQFGLGGGVPARPPRPPQFRPQRLDSEQVKLGRELFTRDWQKHKESPGDGLGPMFNAVSCVACHEKGNVGGAGGNQHNVNMLSLVSPKPAEGGFRTRQRAALTRIHPDLSPDSLSVTIHSYAKGSSVNGTDTEYHTFRADLLRNIHLPGMAGSGSRSQGPVQFRKDGGFMLEFSQRSTPALFGAGLIDQVPDRALIEVAAHQKKNVPGISGRVPQTTSGTVGRFGWRGQSGSLHEFVLGACVNELGLQVSKGRQEPNNPVNVLARMGEGPDTKFIPPVRFNSTMVKTSTTPDLTGPETQALTSFLYSLDAPRPLSGLRLQQSQLALEGHKLFDKAGCAHCHVQSMGPARDVYSDLLLHDMGQGLSDSVSAIPEIDAREIPVPSGYYGGTSIELLVNVTTNIRQEWRTAPLWGLRSSAPYLHDGRASTVDEAIRLHGGEARASARKYQSMSAANRDKVLAFLNTLDRPGAPPQLIAPGSLSPVFRGGGLSAGGSGFFSLSPRREASGIRAFSE